jgi:hypothetical protein
MNDLGVNGYRLALDYLCAKSPVTDRYCFSEIFTVLNQVDASSFCSKLKPVGCCSGTVFSFVTECAAANDTIATSVGAISMSDLVDFCPEINFKDPCSNIEKIKKGVCLEGFYLSGAWPSAKASFALMGLSAVVAVAVNMLF